VLVLEKQPALGGTTGLAVGSITATGTRLQQQAGIEDDVAAHVEDAGQFGPPQIEAGIRNCDGSSWLMQPRRSIG
jgi:fumarate reductase flavoprotein subunit